MLHKILKIFFIFPILILFITLTFQTSQAETREFTVVNIETPQAVKIWEPPSLVVKKGDTVKIKLINKSEQEHGYRIADFKVEKVVQSEQSEAVEFTADKEGIFVIDCQLHPAHVQGQLIVLP
jgi:nitrosocyanin